MLVVVLVWVCPGDAGVAGCAGTVKRGGMCEIIRKVKGHTFPEILVAQKVWRDYCTDSLVSAH
jgi:hypothetical protein